MSEGLQHLKIILLSIVVVICYGIANDQITARLTIEFYRIFGFQIEGMSPTIVALMFGIISTWWMGLFLGVILSISARLGSRPKVDAREIFHFLAYAVATVGLTSATAGVVVWMLPIDVTLPPHIQAFIPKEKNHLFYVVNTIHLFGYFGGLIAGIVVAALIYAKRKANPNLSSQNFHSPRETNRQHFQFFNLQKFPLVPRWMQGILFSMLCIGAFTLYYYIPPGFFTIAFTVGIGSFLVWIILDPARRYIRLLSVMVGIWGSSTVIPHFSGVAKAAGIEVNWNIGESVSGEFHIAFAILAIGLLIADYLERSRIENN